MNRLVQGFSVLLFICLTPEIACAHAGHGVTCGGAVEGILHPLLGLDHLLAMVTVGLLIAEIGGRAKWLIPGSFLGFMICGGIAGMTAWQIPGVEFGIAASIVFLGAAVAANKKSPLIVSLVFAGLFGLFHGHAHNGDACTCEPWPLRFRIRCGNHCAAYSWCNPWELGHANSSASLGTSSFWRGYHLCRNLVCLSH